jgi:L-threonylcarbamoyladenylate synthase
VLDLTTTPPTIRRPGAVTRAQIAAVIGAVEMGAGIMSEDQPAASPGQHAKHYAPKAAAHLFDVEQWPAVQSWCESHAAEKWAVILIGETLKLKKIDRPMMAALARGLRQQGVIRMPDGAEKYARYLYAMLRRLDEQGVTRMWIERPPETAEWAAVRDRLNRATTAAKFE